MDQTKYKVTMEDGSTYEVVSDQRDVAKWEVQPFGTPWSEAATRLFTYSRFRAWSAARRAKKYVGTWEEFGEECVAVDGVEEEAAPDPGQPAASAGI